MLVDATAIALKALGVPIVNTVMLGAFAAASKEVSLTSVLEAIKEGFPERLVKSNMQAATEGTENTTVRILSTPH